MSMGFLISQQYRIREVHLKLKLLIRELTLRDNISIEEYHSLRTAEDILESLIKREQK